MDDDERLDGVVDLSRLSDRQLLERLVRAQERMELFMTAASEYMTAALDSLDVQMRDLQTRLQEDAAELAAAIQALKDGDLNEEALIAAADRVQATAVTVAGLAQPTEVVDPEQPGEAGPLPGDTNNDGVVDENDEPVEPVEGEPVEGEPVEGEPVDPTEPEEPAQP